MQIEIMNDPQVDCTPLKDLNEWKIYITNMHGSDVARVTQQAVDEAIARMESVKVQETLDRLLQQARRYTIPKGITTRFHS